MRPSILMPEGLAAVVAARRNDVQKEHQPGARLVSGHDRADDSGRRDRGLRTRQATRWAFAQGMVLPALTLLLRLLTLGSGRTNILFGLVQLVVFAVFVFPVFVP